MTVLDVSTPDRIRSLLQHWNLPDTASLEKRLVDMGYAVYRAKQERTNKMKKLPKVAHDQKVDALIVHYYLQTKDQLMVCLINNSFHSFINSKPAKIRLATKVHPHLPLKT